jgi:hypothetical protein
MYKLNEAQKREAAFTVTDMNRLNLWHRRMGHLGYGNLRLLRKNRCWNSFSGKRATKWKLSEVYAEKATI